MFRHGRGRSLLAAVVLIFAAACSESPTAPSPVSSSTPSSTAEGADPDAAAGTQDTFGVPGAVGAMRFVAFGDSITQGVESLFDGFDDILFDSPGIAYPTQMFNFLSSRHGGQTFVIINRGVGGETAASGAQRLQSVLSGDRPQALLLLEGINDLNAGANVSSTVNTLRSMVEMAQLFNVPVFVGNMFRTYRSEQTLPDGTIRVRENANHLIPSFNSAIAQMVQGRQNVRLVDINGAFGDDRSLVGNDGLHPTPNGYGRMAQTFGAAIEQAFPVRGAFQ